MGKSAKTPSAPDPAKTAAAQTATNQQTALWNASLQNVNQYTPYGSLVYTRNDTGPTYNEAGYNTAMQNYQTQLNAYNNAMQQQSAAGMGSGLNGVKGADGQMTPAPVAPTAPKYADYKTGDSVPSYNATTTLSPEQQQLLDSSNRQSIALNRMGEAQLGRIDSNISTPFSFNGLSDAPNSSDYATNQASGQDAILSRLNPQFDKDYESLATRLANQGIQVGSDAYNSEMNNFNNTKTDARMQAVLQGANYANSTQQAALQRRQQAIQEYTTQRNAPLNELTALTSGTQVTNPSFNNTSYQGAAPVDYTSLVNNQYQSQLAAANAKNASSNSMMSGLFGLGGSALSGYAGSAAGSAAISALFSDERLKERVIELGKENGHNIYEFSYTKDSGLADTNKRFIGVMAQEVLKIDPDAVVLMDNGFYAVDYNKIGVSFREVGNASTNN